jgi:glycosyltransferase involved in cell wall biosynthesis
MSDARPGREVHVVLPGDVDDPRAPSGGNTYDRRLCQGLARAGWSVREMAVPGAWPRAAPADRAAFARALAAVPDRAVVLLDGLVACAAPEVVGPESDRLSLALLVHLPLGDEKGLPPDAAAELDAGERRVLRAAAAVVATSGWAAGRLVEHHGLPPHRVHVAAPGVDPAPLAAGTDGATQLLCVAAVTPRKGHDLLLEALAGLAGRPWRCVCAGPLDRAPAHAGRVRRLARDRDLAGRVHLVGPRTGTDLATAYDGADLVVLPSRAETYGMVVTEALARGIPVVATDVGGVPEALGRAPGGARPGMLVPPADPAALGRALRRWLDEPATRHRLRQAARGRRTTLPGWHATARAVSGVLDRLPATSGRVA